MFRAKVPQISELLMGHREGLAGTDLTWEVSGEQGGRTSAFWASASLLYCLQPGRGSEASKTLSMDSHHAAST